MYGKNTFYNGFFTLGVKLIYTLVWWLRDMTYLCFVTK